MGIESQSRRDPTTQDLQEIEIQATGLGRGDKVHAIEFILGMLRRIMIKATKDGWEEHLRKSWEENVAEIRKEIAQIKTEQAREKGLL